MSKGRPLGPKTQEAIERAVAARCVALRRDLAQRHAEVLERLRRRLEQLPTRGEMRVVAMACAQLAYGRGIDAELLRDLERIASHLQLRLPG